MGYDVFISHSSKDKQTADAVCLAMERNGLNCWIAPRDVKPGFTYGAQIIEAIKSCAVFVLIFSQNSNLSDDVKTELQNAFKRKKVILPLRIDDTEMDSEFEYFLSAKQWVTLQALDEHFSALVLTVRQAVHDLRAETVAAPAFAKHINTPDPTQSKAVAIGERVDLKCGVAIAVDHVEIANTAGGYTLSAHCSIANISKYDKLSITDLLYMFTNTGEIIECDPSYTGGQFFSFPLIIERGTVYSASQIFRIPVGAQIVALFVKDEFAHKTVGPIVNFYMP